MPRGKKNTTPHSSPPRRGLGAPPKLGGELVKETRNIFEDVFEVVRLIPKGRVTNYGSIA
ncbi:MAG: hypothetical protein RL152_1266, partial [Bacteroidota bacterium]